MSKPFMAPPPPFYFASVFRPPRRTVRNRRSNHPHPTPPNAADPFHHAGLAANVVVFHSVRVVALQITPVRGMIHTAAGSRDPACSGEPWLKLLWDRKGLRA